MEIERGRRAAAQAAVSRDDAVTPIETAIIELTRQIDDVVAGRKAARKEARRRVPTPELDAEYVRLRDTRRALMPTLKAARALGVE